MALTCGFVVAGAGFETCDLWVMRRASCQSVLEVTTTCRADFPCRATTSPRCLALAGRLWKFTIWGASRDDKWVERGDARWPTSAKYRLKDGTRRFSARYLGADGKYHEEWGFTSRAHIRWGLCDTRPARE